MWHVYFRGGRFFVPVVAQTDAGYFLDIDPVATVPGDAADALATCVSAAIDRGNPRVPAPLRHEFPAPVVLAPAGVKTWATFERKAACWTITRDAGNYTVAASGRGADGKWIEDPASKVQVGVGEGPAAIAAVILQQRNARRDL
jgi:hypothetical protein